MISRNRPIHPQPQGRIRHGGPAWQGACHIELDQGSPKRGTVNTCGTPTEQEVAGPVAKP